MGRLSPFKSLRRLLDNNRELDIFRMRRAQSLSFRLANRVGGRGAGWFSTIRARLYCAFGFAAALTIVGSFTALYEFNALGEITSEILSYTFPATVVSLRLAEEASSLVSSAPRLMTAVDDKTRLDTANGVGRQAKSLEEGITRLRELGIGTADEIDMTRKALVQRLDGLNQAVKDRIIISNERRYMASSVRKAHEDLLIALAPAIDDANFDLMMRSKTAAVDSTLSSDLESLRRLLETESESNLLAGLLT